MFSHVMLGANDLEASAHFYNALLGQLGAKPGVKDRYRYFWRHAGNTFSVTTPRMRLTASFSVSPLTAVASILVIRSPVFSPARSAGHPPY